MALAFSRSSVPWVLPAGIIGAAASSRLEMASGSVARVFWISDVISTIVVLDGFLCKIGTDRNDALGGRGNPAALLDVACAVLAIGCCVMAMGDTLVACAGISWATVSCATAS